MKQDSLPAVGAAATAALVLLYAMFGHPPFGYFGFMKLVVAVAAGYVTYAMYMKSRHTVPLGVVLVALGWVEFTGEMRRPQWLPWNWATLIALGLAAMVLIWPDISRRADPAPLSACGDEDISRVTSGNATYTNRTTESTPSTSKAVSSGVQEGPEQLTNGEQPEYVVDFAEPLNPDEEWRCRCGEWNPGESATCLKCKRSVRALI